MTKFFIASVMILLVPLYASGAVVELIPDPGCEGPGGWADRADGSSNIAYQQGNAHGGNYCIGITGAFSERVESEPRFDIPDGGAFMTGSAWLKNTNGASRVGLYINCYNGTTFTNRSLQEVNTTSTDWAQVVTSVTSTYEATHASLLVYAVNNGSPGKHFDDVSFSAIPSSPLPTPSETPTETATGTATDTPTDTPFGTPPPTSTPTATFDSGCEGVNGWADRQDGSANIAYQQGNAHGGNYCIGITGGFSERVESEPPFDIPDGGAFMTGSAWLKNTNGASRVGLYINCYNGTSFTNRSLQEVNTTSADWAQVVTSVTSTYEATHASLLVYAVNNGSPGKHFDDVSFSAIPSSPLPTPSNTPTVTATGTSTDTPTHTPFGTPPPTSTATATFDSNCEGISGWADRQDGSANIAYQQGNAHGGNYCIGITGGFSERVESEPPFDIPDGGAFMTGSAWLKNTNGASRVGLYINCYDGATFTNRSLTEVNTTSTDWAQVVTSVTSSYEATHASLLIYAISNGSPGKHFDDVSFSALPASPLPTETDTPTFTPGTPVPEDTATPTATATPTFDPGCEGIGGWADRVDGSATLTYQEGDAHGGSYCIGLKGLFVERVETVPFRDIEDGGALVQGSAWVKNTNGSGRVGLFVNCYDGTRFTNRSMPEVSTTSTEWSQLVTSVTSTYRSTHASLLISGVNNLSPGKHFDDVSLSSQPVQVSEPISVADFDCDGKVEMQDVSGLLTQWGRAETVYDLNGDNIVDGEDLFLLTLYWMQNE